MSKINQIQNRLWELDGGRFQKFADAYLHKKGYERINSLGSVIGSDKLRQGTPDTLVPLSNGKYVFAEHTTQEEGVYKKLKSDLSKCFDEEKTGIPIKSIGEVVFCHTSKLKSAEEIALANECRSRGVNLNIFGIDSLSYDLYQKYPGLARDFLNVEVDTGQVVLPDEFIANYNKNKLATPLSTAFHFRDNEVERVLKGLKETNLVTVSGRAGVGKSRLALECCFRFKEAHPEYAVRCIFNRGPDLFEDLRVHFSDSGSYLIFVDDANRVNRVEYVLQLLHDQNDDRKIKVIATVRDYALDKVREAARPYGGGAEIELQALEEKQLKQLIENACGIKNHLYLERIANIAQGNPRLAIMAAQIAKREKTLQSIGDVSVLYDEYYSSIRRDLEDLSDQNLLKVAGIIAFLRVVDCTNEEMMHAVETAFAISPEAFWEAAQRLHDLEVLDMYENEVVRISDQVLATYLFYLAFFKEKVLGFSALLKHFFPLNKDRLIDAINPVLGAFNAQALMEIMRPQVDQAWQALEDAGNEEGLLHLMEVFWFLKKTDTLLYIRDLISEMEPESADLSQLEIKSGSNIPSPSLLSVLTPFQYSEESTFRTTLNLLFDYLVKRPADLAQIFYLLTDRCGFKHDSYAYGFIIQRAVIEILWERTRQGEDELFSRLFLAVAKQYLPTRLHTTELKGRHTLNMINFDLPPTPKLFELRQKIWDGLFQLYQLPDFQEAVLSVLHNYSTSRYQAAVKEITAQDATAVLPFIASELKPDSYRHCLVVQDFLDLLDDHKVSFDKELQSRFKDETFMLSDLLFLDRNKRRNLDLDYKEYQQLRRRWITEYFGSYDLSDYNHFFKQCLDIRAELSDDHKEFQLQSGVIEVFLALADQNSTMYPEVLKHYLELGNPLNLNPYFLVFHLIKTCGINGAYKILEQPDYPNKRQWLIDYYRSLPDEEITAEHLDQLYALYQNAELGELPQDIDFFLKYRQVDEEVVARIAAIILQRAGVDPRYAYSLSPLFDPHTEANKNLLELFKSNLDLLKQAYLVVLELEKHMDYSGQTFTRMLDLDPSFILEYIDRKYKKNEWLSRYDDTCDYSFLWKRDDCEEIMHRVTEHIYKKEQEQVTSWHTYLERFFILTEEGKDNPAIKKRQDQFLRSLIARRCEDSSFVQFVFNVIAQFSPERRQPFVSFFLKHNRNFVDFEKLPLEPNSWSWSGSEVPILQSRVEYYESLLPLLDTVDFLQHKQHVERWIQELRKKIEQEKREDFMKD
jgi:hypothetical protein